MGVWDSRSLDFIVDKDTYDQTLVNDNNIAKVMNEKGVVIWGVGGDGKRSMEVRINPQNELENKEKEYLEMESQEYKLVISSGTALVGSPEWAGKLQEDGLKNKALGIRNINLENGVYSLKVYFLSWDFTDSSLNDLPEYIVVLKKVENNYRFVPVKIVETLD